jgi:hypothetical protein
MKTPALPPSKPPLDRHRTRHDACQGQDSPARLSIARHCAPCRHTAPKAMRYDCKPPPWSIKGGGGPLATGGQRIANSLAFPPSPTILALCLNQPSETWRLLLSRLACSSPLRGPRCLAIQRNERTPARRTAHDRNQDKPRVLVLLSTSHRETDLSALSS